MHPHNQKALKAGTRHHWWKAVGERVAGVAVAGGWLLLITAALLLWWVWR